MHADGQTGGYSDANSRYSCVITRLRWVIYFVRHCSHIRAAFYPRKAAAGDFFFPSGLRGRRGRDECGIRSSLAAVLFPPLFFSLFPPPVWIPTTLAVYVSTEMKAFSDCFVVKRPSPPSLKPCSVQSCFCHCSKFLSPPTREQSILVRILKGGCKGVAFHVITGVSR